MKKLTPQEEYVCLMKGTEAPFTGQYWDCKDEGMYRCKVCEEPLFSSKTKFDSGSGWPSFYEPERASAVVEIQDNSHNMQRTEITCHKCGAHLGHVFPDGPEPTGLRYCINSAALDLDRQG